MMKILFASLMPLLLLPQAAVGSIQLVSCDNSCESDASVQLFESCQSPDVYVFGGGTNKGANRRLSRELTEEEQDDFLEKALAVGDSLNQHRNLQTCDPARRCGPPSTGFCCDENPFLCCFFCESICSGCQACGERRLRGRELADTKKHVPDSCEEEFPIFCGAEATCTAYELDMTMADLEFQLEEYEKILKQVEKQKEYEQSKIIKKIEKEDEKN